MIEMVVFIGKVFLIVARWIGRFIPAHVDISINILVVFLAMIADYILFAIVYREDERSYDPKKVKKYWRIGVVMSIVKFVILEGTILYWTGGVTIVYKAIPFIIWAVASILALAIVAFFWNYIPRLYVYKTHYRVMECWESQDHTFFNFLGFMFFSPLEMIFGLSPDYDVLRNAKNEEEETA